MPNTLIRLTPLIALIIAAILYGIHIIRLRAKYNKYISEDGPATGAEAISRIMGNSGYNAKLSIAKPSHSLASLNPFYGNFYLPDRHLFVLQRAIADGKSLLSFCIGCQLAAAAVNYHSGQIKNPNATYVEGEYVLAYKFNQEEIDKVKESLEVSQIRN